MRSVESIANMLFCTLDYSSHFSMFCARSIVQIPLKECAVCTSDHVPLDLPTGTIANYETNSLWLVYYEKQKAKEKRPARMYSLSSQCTGLPFFFHAKYPKNRESSVGVCWSVRVSSYFLIAIVESVSPRNSKFRFNLFWLNLGDMGFLTKQNKAV